MAVTVTAAPGLLWSLTGVKANVFPHGALCMLFSSPPTRRSFIIVILLADASLLLVTCSLSSACTCGCTLVPFWLGSLHPSGEPLGHVLKPSQVGPFFLSSGPRGTCMYPLSIQLNVWPFCNAAASDRSASEQTAVFSPLRYFRPMSDTSPRCSPSRGQSFSILALLKFLA